MALLTNLLYILFSVCLVCSALSMTPLRSIKISENVTYDCIDIYKQPGLDHPSLKTHKIQMKPSVSRYESRNQTSRDKTKYVCPDGTVPIMRNTKEFITNSQLFAEKYSQLFAEKYFHQLSYDSPGTHMAGPFHGVKALFNAYMLNVEKDQASYSHIYVGSKMNNEVNFISLGWMINPSQFPEGHVWTYGFWKGKDGKGCYNTACPGFVQVSQKIPIVEPTDIKPGVPGWLHCSLHQDKNTGNWWITQLFPHAPSEDIGYWPKELFNLIDNGANVVGVGGMVQASHSGLSPPMGNGKFLNGGRTDSAIFANIEVLNSNYKQRKMNSFPTEKLLDSMKCYGFRYGKVKPFYQSQLGFFFNYGGPGGNSCGI